MKKNNIGTCLLVISLTAASLVFAAGNVTDERVLKDLHRSRPGHGSFQARIHIGKAVPDHEGKSMIISDDEIELAGVIPLCDPDERLFKCLPVGDVGSGRAISSDQLLARMLHVRGASPSDLLELLTDSNDDIANTQD